MSKAFVKDSDESPDDPLPRSRGHTLPRGVKNYMTKTGADRLREKLDRLIRVARPAAAESAGNSDSAADVAERRRRLREIDRQIQGLRESLESAEIIEPAMDDTECVRFGAAVTVCDGGGNESTYHIVGVDEADADAGRVSWLSPVAKALLNARVGDVASLRLPEGTTKLTILAVKPGHG